MITSSYSTEIVCILFEMKRIKKNKKTTVFQIDFFVRITNIRKTYIYYPYNCFLIHESILNISQSVKKNYLTSFLVYLS